MCDCFKKKKIILKHLEQSKTITKFRFMTHEMLDKKIITQYADELLKLLLLKKNSPFPSLDIVMVPQQMKQANK